MFFDSNSKTLFIFEFNEIRIEIDPTSEFEFKEDTLHLSEKNYKHLLRLADSTGAFSILNRAKGSFIKFTNHVGTIWLRGNKIQVLPKVLDIMIKSKDSLNLVKKNFARMLEYWIYHISNLSVKPIELAPQLVEEFNLLEIYAYIFSRKAYELVSNQPLREYIREQENLTFIKGKINFKSLVMKSHLKNRVPCIYFNYTRDNIINRAILYTSYYLYRMIKWRRTRKYLNSIISILRDVDLKPINPYILDKIRFNRLNKPYEQIIELSKILLMNLTPAPIQGAITTYAFLVPMENVFEGFISQVIKREIAISGKIDVQRHIGHLAKKESGKSMFKLIPDIVIKNKNNEATIIDLKYKKLDSTKQNLGIESSDIQQMYSYLAKLIKEYRKVKGILIYPKYQNDMEEILYVEIPIQKNQKQTYETQIKVVTIDLTIDMQKEWSKFIQELKTVIMK